MANSSNYRVQLRRRREGKTDYQARKAIVISGRPRLVTRTSLKNANAQIIIAKPIGDHTVAAANSRELIKKYGWKAPAGNLPAAYLTGLLCGLKAKTAGIDEAILDIGLIPPTKGARIFAILHGVIDANVEIPHGDKKIVENRAKGDHIAYYAKALQTDEDTNTYKAKFTKYNAQGIAPETIAEHFSKVRNNIIAAFKDAQVAPEPPSAPQPKTKPKPKTETKPTTKPKPTETQPTATTEQQQPKPSKATETAPTETKEAKAPEEVVKPKTKVAKETPPEETEAPTKVAKEKAAPTKASVKKAETAPAKTKAAKEEEIEEESPTKEKASSKKKTPEKKEPAAKAVAKPKKGEKKE